MDLRELAAADEMLLGEMLYIAAFGWQEGERPPAAVVLAHPQAAMYYRGWGRPGDAGLVAEVDDEPAGVAWYRLFTEAEHGDGFVDETTPELAIAVRENHRGRGIGTALMHAMHERARVEGVRQLSLSVDDRNRAKRLYAGLGYREHNPGDGRGRMILDLR